MAVTLVSLFAVGLRRQKFEVRPVHGVLGYKTRRAGELMDAHMPSMVYVCPGTEIDPEQWKRPVYSDGCQSRVWLLLFYGHTLLQKPAYALGDAHGPRCDGCMNPVTGIVSRQDRAAEGWYCSRRTVTFGKTRVLGYEQASGLSVPRSMTFPRSWRW
ncbi:hypothetical protein LY76DRAFT_397268 [Colletotrichum caudatum]|nr:hypothetical protein LY76DRAFT_397268 [Colletotrichum caudatum]